MPMSQCLDCPGGREMFKDLNGYNLVNRAWIIWKMGYVCNQVAHGWATHGQVICVPIQTSIIIVNASSILNLQMSVITCKFTLYVYVYIAFQQHAATSQVQPKRPCFLAVIVQ